MLSGQLTGLEITIVDEGEHNANYIVLSERFRKATGGQRQQTERHRRCNPE